jgi:hypothetical protein
MGSEAETSLSLPALASIAALWRADLLDLHLITAVAT